MILVCPLCQTRYLVQAAMFAMGARTVRCARCKHSWKAELPKEIDVVAPPIETIPIPDGIAPLPEGSNLPALTKAPFSSITVLIAQIAAGVILTLILMWLILDRQHLAHRWVWLEPVYNAIGLYIYYPGDGLEFDQVHSELKYDSGRTLLVLDGIIKNKTQKNQKVPPLIADALGPDGVVIQSWQIDPPTATLAPAAEVPFTSSLNAPKGTVVNVNLNFVEMKDDN